VLGLQKANLHAPLIYGGDALLSGANIKTIFETGWYEHQPRLGAPAGQVFHDFPAADNLHMVIMKLFSPFTDNWALAMNVYFFLGFPLAAIAAIWFLRTVGVSRPVAGALAIAYAWAPYHFVRSESHLWLSSYYAVPLALTLLVLVFQGKPLWGWNSRRRGAVKYLLSPSMRTVAITGLVVADSSYYGIFFLLLLALVGFFFFAIDRDIRKFGAAVATGFTTLLWLALNILPDVLYRAKFGSNSTGFVRYGSESEVYPLKFAQLVLPWANHRIPFLAHLRFNYDSHYPTAASTMALGLLAAIGFVASFIVVLYVVFSRTRFVSNSARLSDTSAMLAGLAGVNVLAFMFATLGGLSALISLISPVLRCWDRMMIFIAIVSLGVTGILVDRALAWYRQRQRRGPLRGQAPWIAAIALVAVAFVDQTSPAPVAYYEYVNNQFIHDDAYFGEVETVLDAGDTVLMLPYREFPETFSLTGLESSDQLIPYLHTKDLRWTAGGIKGRPTSDWPGTLGSLGLDTLIESALLAGCDGILVDRLALTDGGVALEQALAVSGVAPMVSPDGQYAFYLLNLSMVPHMNGLDETVLETLKADITNPVIALPAVTELPYRDARGLRVYEVSPTGAQVILRNAMATPRSVVLSFYVDSLSDQAGGQRPSSIQVLFPDGVSREVSVRASDGQVQVPIEVPVGDSAFSISPAPDASGAIANITISSVSAPDAALAGFLVANRDGSLSESAPK
jgi:phosphoglycerol transferase